MTPSHTTYRTAAPENHRSSKGGQVTGLMSIQTATVLLRISV